MSTPTLCPVSKRTDFPCVMSHSLMVLSLDPVATYLQLGWNWTHWKKRWIITIIIIFIWFIKPNIHSVECSKHRGNIESTNTGDEYDNQKEASNKWVFRLLLTLTVLCYFELHMTGGGGLSGPSSYLRADHHETWHVPQNCAKRKILVLFLSKTTAFCLGLQWAGQRNRCYPCLYFIPGPALVKCVHHTKEEEPWQLTSIGIRDGGGGGGAAPWDFPNANIWAKTSKFGGKSCLFSSSNLFLLLLLLVCSMR